MNTTIWKSISEHISAVTEKPFEVQHQHPVGGGSINQTYGITGGDRTYEVKYFVKLNEAGHLPMFEAEALGLAEIERSQTIRVPKPLCWGQTHSGQAYSTQAHAAYLVMEWIDLDRGSRESWAAMGRQLAAMHRTFSDQGYGWSQNNTIGATPQLNPWTATWSTFFLEHRLGYQFRLARRRGGHFPKQDALLVAAAALLTEHFTAPSLVHGDLWSGNAAITQQGEPIILDPAVYYGDREVDVAMTELFGGFPSDFYCAYENAFPLEAGYPKRKVLYNLYHVINHFNLFGGSYEAQANQMIEQLLR